MNPERQSLQLRYKKICVEGLAKPLRKAGFKRIGNRYAKWIGDEFCYVVWPYRGKVTLPGESSFTVDCNVFVGATWDVFAELYPGPGRHISETIGVRISQICNDPGDKWWELHAGDPPLKDDEIIADLRRRTESCVLPWFTQFQGLEDIGDYLAATEPAPGRHRFGYREIVQAAGDLRNAAIAYYAAGQYKQAREKLGLAEKCVGIPASKAMTADLKARIERLIARKLNNRA